MVYSYHEALREDPSGSSARFGAAAPMVINWGRGKGREGRVQGKDILLAAPPPPTPNPLSLKSRVNQSVERELQ